MHRLAKSSVLSFILILPQLSLASQKKSYSRALQNLGTLVLIAQNLTYASHEDRTCEHDGTFNEAKDTVIATLDTKVTIVKEKAAAVQAQNNHL